ncbi:hypothetical protein [Lacinutrix sp. MEBiC02595]
MKPNILLLLLLLMLILASCKSNSQNIDILLTGKIGEFDAQMSLEKDGDFFNGLFTYKNVNNKQIKLKGQIENDELRIYEFNNENEITGLFSGKYSESGYNGEWNDINGKVKVPFLFTKSKTLVSSKKVKKQEVTELKSKELLETYFEAKEYKTDSIATYITTEESYEIEFLKFENYNLESKQYSLAIFGNYPLYDELGDGDFQRGLNPYQIGDSAFSVIKFVKEGNNWVFVNMVEKFETGVTPLDHLPKIKQIGNFTFLELNNITQIQGIEYISTKFVNIINFQESLNIFSIANQGIDGIDVDEFIKEMNNSYGDLEHTKSWSASNVMNKFTIQNEKLLCIVDYISGKFDEKKNKFVKEEITKIYTYHEDNMKFVELK